MSNFSQKKAAVASFVRERQVGDLTIILPEPPEDITQIGNYNVITEDCMFTPVKLPNDKEFDSWTEESKDEFVFAEFKKRKHGYWFFNYNEDTEELHLEYITGIHYFYISFWQIDVGLPEFRDLDRDFFYFWDYCVNDDDCLGICYIAKRREGKTHKFACILYEATTLKKRIKSGIQSKTRIDAKKLFKFIVSSWKKLPKFFKPTDSGDTNPQSSLRFEEPSKRGVTEKIYKDVLDSVIDYEATIDTAYDGQKLYRYGLDEFGKNVELNVSELWDIVKFCLMLGNKIIGKAILVTTVEEMSNKGGKHAKTIWDNSGYLEKNNFARTTSGLYRLFFPAYYGLEGFINKNGYSRIDQAKEYLENERSRLSGEKLAAYRRKFPFTITECFRTDKDSEFDVARIYDQLDYNAGQNDKLIRGNFVWEVQYESAKFMENQNGRWLVYKLPPVELRNKYVLQNTRMSPGNQLLYVSGCDPFDANRTTGNKQSNAASYTFRLFDGFDKQETNIFVAQYIARPPKAEIFYEDMLMQCIFYGMQILVESNKPGLLNYFERLGFQYYLMKRPEFSVGSNRLEYGIPMSGQASRETLIRCLQSWIYDYIGFHTETDEDNIIINEWVGNCQFDDLLHDLVDFDVDDWTPHDQSVAAGLTLIAANKNLLKKKVDNKPVRVNIPVFSTRGVRSQRLK